MLTAGQCVKNAVLLSNFEICRRGMQIIAVGAPSKLNSGVAIVVNSAKNYIVKNLKIEEGVRHWVAPANAKELKINNPILKPKLLLDVLKVHGGVQHPGIPTQVRYSDKRMCGS